MTLSDVEFWAEVAAGWLTIEPTPTLERVGGSSVDLILHNELLVLPCPNASSIAGTSIDPTKLHVSGFLKSNTKPHDLGESRFQMLPQTFLLGKTKETIWLPNHLAARVEGKSSLGRLGLSVHMTAPTVQAGYEGRLTLEMYNAGPFTLQLTKDMEICQLIIERLGIPTKKPYSGQFQGQS